MIFSLLHRQKLQFHTYHIPLLAHNALTACQFQIPRKHSMTLTNGVEGHDESRCKILRSACLASQWHGNFAWKYINIGVLEYESIVTLLFHKRFKMYTILQDNWIVNCLLNREVSPASNMFKCQNIIPKRNLISNFLVAMSWCRQLSILAILWNRLEKKRKSVQLTGCLGCSVFLGGCSVYLSSRVIFMAHF